MLSLFHYYLISVVMMPFQQALATYIYQNTQGGLSNNMLVEFNIFMNDSISGLFFYAFDLIGNKILFKFEDLDAGKMTLKFNSLSSPVDRKLLCGCLSCSGKMIRFLIKLEENKLILRCNNHSESALKYDPSIRKKPSRFKPNRINSNSDKTYFKIGIMESKASQIMANSGMVACVEKFYLNGTIVTFRQFNNYFLPTCDKEYEENSCFEKNCTSKKIVIDIFYCPRLNLVASNEAHQSVVISNTHISFMKSDNVHTVVSITYVRIEQNRKGICLLDLILKDGTQLVFLLNESKQLVLYSKTAKSVINEIIISKRIPDGIQDDLLISFNQTHFFIKVCGTVEIVTYMGKFSNGPALISPGLSSSDTLCSSYEGTINVSYSPMHFKIHSKTKSVAHIILISTAVTLVAILLFGILFYICRRRKRFRKEIRASMSVSIPLDLMSTADTNTDR